MQLNGYPQLLEREVEKLLGSKQEYVATPVILALGSTVLLLLFPGAENQNLRTPDL